MNEQIPFAVVTGGASGIGAATARRLTEDGVRVIIADLNPAGQAVADELRSQGPGAAFVQLDVADAAAVEAAASQVLTEIGPVHILVNAAGILQDPVPIDALDLEEHDRIWSINYRGSYLCARAFGRQMAEAGRGAIVNVGSITGLRSTPHLAYGPAKAAILHLTQSLAAEWGRRGVRVNAVAPGFTLTPPIEARLADGRRDFSKVTASSCLGRLVRPEEVAAAIVFLCSDDATAITGATLPVDCGWIAGESWASLGGVRPGAAG